MLYTREKKKRIDYQRRNFLSLSYTGCSPFFYTFQLVSVPCKVHSEGKNVHNIAGAAQIQKKQMNNRTESTTFLDSLKIMF